MWHPVLAQKLDEMGVKLKVEGSQSLASLLVT